MEDTEITSPLVGEGKGEGEREGRDYTRKVYQNLMQVCELLDKAAPLPMAQKAIVEATGMSKAVVFDVCWNLVKRGWAEEAGAGGVRLKKGTSDDDARMGRMVKRLVRDVYSVDLDAAVRKED